MSDLERFRDHCRDMQRGGHTPACIQALEKAKQRWAHLYLFREWLESWGEKPTAAPRPCAGDCISAADRALFARLADEVDAYLTHDDAPLWEDA